MLMVLATSLNSITSKSNDVFIGARLKARLCIFIRKNKDVYGVYHNYSCCNLLAQGAEGKAFIPEWHDRLQWLLYASIGLLVAQAVTDNFRIVLHWVG
jgi:hypothetical protein